MPMESHEKAAEFHDSPHKRTVLVLRTTGKKITRPDSIIAKTRWNIRVKLLSCPRKLIESLSIQRGNHQYLFSGITPCDQQSDTR
jgi:hypothetical protein